MFTVARELGFKVLEFNASSQRFTPCLIQKELNHSLQSYYINHNQQQQRPNQQQQSTTTTLTNNNCNNKPIVNFFMKKQNNTFPNKKIKKNINANKKSTNNFKSKVKLSKSLILIDDIEGIIYENVNIPELWRSLRQMIVNARKPIVFTSQLSPNFLYGNNEQEQHCFTSVELKSIGFLFRNIIGNKIIYSGTNNKEMSGEAMETEGGMNKFFEKLLLMNDKTIQFDGDIRKFINHAHFWYDYGGMVNMSTSNNNINNKQHESNTNTHDLNLDYNLTTISALFDLFSLEDVYQTLFDHLWFECFHLDQRSYDHFLYDHRCSLLFTPTESASINRGQYDLQKLSSSSFDLQQYNSKNSTIKHLLCDHYQLSCHQFLNFENNNSGGNDLLTDCFNFFYELSSIDLNLMGKIQDIKFKLQQSSSSTLCTNLSGIVTRSCSRRQLLKTSSEFSKYLL